MTMSIIAIGRKGEKMKTGKIGFIFILGIFIAVVFAIIPRTVLASCGGAGPPCPPPNKKHNPTATPLIATYPPTPTQPGPNASGFFPIPSITPTPTITATPLPWRATYEACFEGTMIAVWSITPPVGGNQLEDDENTADSGCWKKYSPTATPTIPFGQPSDPVVWSAYVFVLMTAGLLVLIGGILIGAFIMARGRNGNNK